MTELAAGSFAGTDDSCETVESIHVIMINVRYDTCRFSQPQLGERSLLNLKSFIITDQKGKYQL